MKILILILVLLSIFSIFIGVKDISIWDIPNLNKGQIIFDAK